MQRLCVVYFCSFLIGTSASWRSTCRYNRRFFEMPLEWFITRYQPDSRTDQGCRYPRIMPRIATIETVDTHGHNKSEVTLALWSSLIIPKASEHPRDKNESLCDTFYMPINFYQSKLSLETRIIGAVIPRWLLKLTEPRLNCLSI